MKSAPLSGAASAWCAAHVCMICPWRPQSSAVAATSKKSCSERLSLHAGKHLGISVCSRRGRANCTDWENGMNHDDLHYMGMREIGLAIQAGELSSEAVTERQFERIAQLDGRLKSYALLMKDGALRARPTGKSRRASCAVRCMACPWPSGPVLDRRRADGLRHHDLPWIPDPRGRHGGETPARGGRRHPGQGADDRGRADGSSS